MNAVGYTRVSSRGQDLAMQKLAIERAAAARGDNLTHWYSEKKTGTTLDREELARLRSDLRAGRLAGHRIYVFRLDRLSRGGIRPTLEIIEEVRSQKNVELTTCADGFDLNGPAAEIVCAVLAWAGRMEMLARSERISAARDRLAAEGRHWGRPTRVTPEQRKKMVQMKAAGRSIRAISVAMKIPRATVGRALAAAALQAHAHGVKGRLEKVR